MQLNIPGHPDLQKIVVLNPKGGSGKTTLATNLAGYLAAAFHRAALIDFDPQASATRWLQLRPGERPEVFGISAMDHSDTVTRSWRLRVPSEIRYLVIDTPAALPVHELIQFTRGAHAILVPVLPSDIDIHAASRLIANLLLVAKVSRRMGRLGVVANRVRDNTLSYRKLSRFLERLSIATVGQLRDSQNYVHAAERGVSVLEMPAYRVRKELERWEPLLAWLEQRLATPLTARDLHRPHKVPGESARVVPMPGVSIPGFAFNPKN